MMKPAVKISSLLLAVVMLISVLLVSGCSLGKEWSYKTSEKELAIGVYICALRSAYSKAETKAKELEDYDSSKDSWLDMEITDDDGNTEVARTWIKQKAEEQCLQYLVIENELKSTGATTDSAKMDEARAQAKTSWEVGQQTMYGQMPAAKTSLEKYGVSLDSYTYVVADAPQNEETLFDFLYKFYSPFLHPKNQFDKSGDNAGSDSAQKPHNLPQFCLDDRQLCVVARQPFVDLLHRAITLLPSDENLFQPVNVFTINH